jgi:type VI secretion system protein
MGLRLEIISQQRQSLGEIGVKDFGQDGGTIGRSLSNDWALPDRNRFLSAKHASVDYRSGSYYIIDTSTNGVFVNEAEQPVGRGRPQRLFDGDRIRIGEYLILAKIELEEGTMDALTLDHGHVDPVDAAQRVSAPEATGYDLLDEHVMTGVGMEIEIADTGESIPPGSDNSLSAQLRAISDVAEPRAHTRSLLLDEDSDVLPRPRPKPAAPPPHASQTAPLPGQGFTQPLPQRAPTARTAAPKPKPQAGVPPVRPVPNPPAAPARPSSAAQSSHPAQPSHPAQQSPIRPQAEQPERRQAPRAVRSGSLSIDDSGIEKPLSAFFRGAGLKARDMNEQERNAMLFLLGQLVRELMTGVTESLHLRAHQKSQLRLANTTIQKKDNNPLKFSAGTSEALTNVLFRTSREYMGPVEAVRDAFADINVHQQNLLKALCTAVPEYVNRLDPVVLEDKFARAGRGSLMGATSRLKHWELYKDLFQVVAHHHPGQLPAQFLEELARAYEEECQREAAARSRKSDKEATRG